MALQMVTVSAINLCRVGCKIKFSKIYLVNFENPSIFSEGTAYCEFVCWPIALILKYVLENYFWSIETSTK